MSGKVDYVTDMPDEPSAPPSNWTVSQIKQEFDKGSIALKTFVNALVTALNSFIDALAANTAAENIGAKITVDGERTNVTLQAAIDAAMQPGGDGGSEIADGSITTAKLSSNPPAVTAEKIADGAVSTVYTGTLTSAGWTGSAAPFRKTVNISGILATDIPIIDVVPSDTYADAVNQIEAWGAVYKATTGDGIITFYASEKPAVDLPFQARCIRK